MSDRYSYTSTALYRSRDGVIAGVCAGIAEHFDWSVFWLRVTLVVAFILTGFFPVVFCYALAALLMKPEPYRY